MVRGWSLALVTVAASGIALGRAATPAVASPSQDDPLQCTPFTVEQDAKNAQAAGQFVVAAWTALHNLPEAKALYDAYLTPGVASASRTHVTAAASLDQFRTAPETRTGVDAMTAKLVEKLRSAPPLPDVPYDLRGTGVGQNLPIAWLDLQTTPGFIAGGLSGVVSSAGTFADTRDITGTYSVHRTPPSASAPAKATLTVHRPILKVQDSIDFCPGNLGTGAVRDTTLAMSRLEHTPYGTQGATYAKPILFDVTVPLDDLSVDVTALYPH